jgi:hypothetical protein
MTVGSTESDNKRRVGFGKLVNEDDEMALLRFLKEKQFPENNSLTTYREIISVKTISNSENYITEYTVQL